MGYFLAFPSSTTFGRYPKMARAPNYPLFDTCGGRRRGAYLSSDSHWHQDVPVFHIFVRVFRPHLSSALGVLELKPHFPGISDRLQKIDQVLAVETHYQRIVVIRRLDR